MIDNKSFDYIERGLPNIKLEVQQGVTDAPGWCIHSKIYDVARRVAKARRDWTIVVHGGYSANISRTAKSFAVYQDREKLGAVTLNSDREGEPYCITNKRMDAKRKRGKDGTFTKDLNKAVKLILTHFGAKTVGEEFADIKTAIYNITNTQQSVTFSKLHQVQGQITTAFTHVLATNYDSVREFLQGRISQDQADALNKYPEAYATRKGTWAIYNTLNKNDPGKFVLLRGDDYHVYNKADDTLELYDTDTLPAWMKRNLGLLKLVEDNYVLADVGVRLNEHRYYLMDHTPKDTEDNA